jgi:hypothetical protein
LFGFFELFERRPISLKPLLFQIERRHGFLPGLGIGQISTVNGLIFKVAVLQIVKSADSKSEVFL